MRSVRVAGCVTAVLLFGMAVSGCGTLGAVERTAGQVVDVGLKAAESAARTARKTDRARKQAEARKRAYESQARQRKQNFNKANKKKRTPHQAARKRHQPKRRR